MPATKLQDLLDPQVLADMISAKLDKKIRAIPYARVDTTLQGRPGSTITVPQFIFDEVAGDVPEGTDIPVRKLGTRMAQYTIKKAGLGAPVTDEALECGYGDPVGAAGTGIVNGIRARTDIDAFEEMLKASVVYDATQEPFEADRVLSYNTVVRGVDKFVEEVASESYIYAAFFEVYGIRLAYVDFLHWWEFMVLFEGLPENTLIQRIIYWRTVDLNNLGKDEKKHIQKMRKIIALKNPERQAVAIEDIDLRMQERVKKRFAQAKLAVQRAKQKAEQANQA